MTRKAREPSGASPERVVESQEDGEEEEEVEVEEGGEKRGKELRMRR